MPPQILSPVNGGGGAEVTPASVYLRRDGFGSLPIPIQCSIYMSIVHVSE
jgi:hypothetical protein